MNRNGEKPHGGWRSSFELVPDSVGWIPRSTPKHLSEAACRGNEVERKVQGGRACAQQLSWLTSEGRKVMRASASSSGNALGESTDSQSEQHSVVGAHGLTEIALDGLS